MQLFVLQAQRKAVDQWIWTKHP